MLLVLARLELRHVELDGEHLLEAVEPLDRRGRLLLAPAKPNLDAVASCATARDDAVDLALLRRAGRRRPLGPGRGALGREEVRGAELEGGTGEEEDEALVDVVEEGGRGRDGDAATLRERGKARSVDERHGRETG